jgi:hypothetical protein
VQQQQAALQQQRRVVRQQRLSAARQQQLIAQQQQRAARYEQRLWRSQELARQRAALLQQQRRMAAYQYQQQYLQRLRQQQAWLDRQYDYSSDPYFYTAPTYRYSRGGRYYETNQYGADLLRRALDSGYEEGYRSGEADRLDHWRSDYRDSWGYQDANYGFSGLYIDPEEYNHYFREGFRRGYEDGYGRQSRYGRQGGDGNLLLLAEVLLQLLDLRSLG